MSWGPRIAALVAPAFVAALGAAWVSSTEDVGDRRAAANLDRVGGVHRKAGRVPWIARTLADHTPRVVIVGDSLAGSHLDPKVLAQRLRLPPAEVVNLALPGSVGPHWYALLDNHVFGAGHHPELVVVAGTFRSMLVAEPTSATNRESLESLLDGDDPVLDGRVGRGPGWVEQLRVDRVKLRRRLVEGIRSAPSALLFGPRHANARVDQAMAEVFDRRQVDLGLRRDLLPTADDARMQDDGDPVAPEDSFLPDLARLVDANGARLVVVRTPVSPRMPVAGRDTVPDAYSAAVDPLVSSYGGLLLDLSTMDLGAERYTDLVHLDDAGAVRFTAIVAERMRRAGATDNARDVGLAAHGGGPGVLVGDGALGGGAFADPPPPLSVQPPTAGAGRTWTWPVPQVAPILDRARAAGIELPARCVPLEVTAGTTPLPPIPCRDLLPGREHGSCFDGSLLYARAATGVGADALWVTADPERRCGPYRWLYPGDELRLAVPPEVGATAAALTVAVVSDGMPRLSIGVAQGGELVVDLPWIPGANVASFLRPVEALPPNAEIVVRNDADRRLVLITEVALRPAEP